MGVLFFKVPVQVPSSFFEVPDQAAKEERAKRVAKIFTVTPEESFDLSLRLLVFSNYGT
jgi:hypothetical protein